MPTYTDRELLKNRQIGTAADYNMAADPAITVGALHTDYFVISKAADAMASTTTAETVTPPAPCPVKCIVKAVKLYGLAAVAADNTDYITATISYRDSTGGNAVTVAVYDSRAANAGALTAFAEKACTLTVANLVCAASGIFTLTVAKGGSGKVLPACTFTIFAEAC